MMNLTKLEFAFLCTNLVALGAAIVLMLLRGPNGPLVLMTVGTAGMTFAKIAKAFSAEDVMPK